MAQFSVFSGWLNGYINKVFLSPNPDPHSPNQGQAYVSFSVPISGAHLVSSLNTWGYIFGDKATRVQS